MKKSKKWIFISLLVFVIFSITTVFICDGIVKRESKEFLYSSTDSIPIVKTALLLGTSKVLSNGKPNAYFEYRIQATIDLYRKGKIHSIVISGDNSKKTYNEPEDMKNALVAAGIPDSCIYLDYAGFRTFDSVVRMNKIFGQSVFIVISQQFHNERAIFIAKHEGCTAYGLNAKEVTAFYGLKTNIREKFARVKLFLDILFNVKPKFLGEKIFIK